MRDDISKISNLVSNFSHDGLGKRLASFLKDVKKAYDGEEISLTQPTLGSMIFSTNENNT